MPRHQARRPAERRAHSPSHNADTMGKTTGFIDTQRAPIPTRPREERIGDWREIYTQRSEEASKAQAGRCMDCGVPFCMQGCPLGNLIPDWNDLVFRGQWHDAFRALESTNNFPEFTGRLCPAPCEASCVLAINMPAVTIEHIEQEIAERAFAEGWVTPRQARVRTDKSVAIVGSGPAGLAAADQLTQAGHDVVVYEKNAQPGGLLRYGIPDFKMEKRILDRRIRVLTEQGVRFVLNHHVGVDLTWTELLNSFDAVLVATGAEIPRDLSVPGRNLRGVHFAMDYLIAQNQLCAGERDALPDDLNAHGKRVIILGGGDTGSDCLGTAVRQGAAHIRQIELLPSPPDTRREDNPWPHWPVVFTTSSSQEEGGEREFALRTTEINGADGCVTELRAVRVDMTQGDDGKRRIQDVDGANEILIDADMILLAMGFTGPATDSLTRELGVTLDRHSAVEPFRTTIPKLYVTGDAYRGASLIVWAISDGREVARCIDADLMEAQPRLPSRGEDRPF